MAKILIIDDDLIILKSFSALLDRKGYDVDTAGTGREGLKAVEEKMYDLILCDYKLPDMEADEFLQEFNKMDRSIQVIVFTGYSSVRSAVNVMKSGAFNYLVKPVVPDLLFTEIERALRAGREFVTDTPGGARNLKQQGGSQSEFIVGTSVQAQAIQRQIRLVAPTDYSVIIYGESGTGKEATAVAIHRMSRRSEKPFIAVDCGVLSRELARSELFGHEKGAFTGAFTAKKGQFELADGGTLFLDEISNLSYEVQGYLLRALQAKRISRLGSNKEIDVDVRILVASNKPLKRAVAEGTFREDLFHRINEYSIDLQPLRELREDIMLFANHYLRQSNRQLGKSIEGFDEQVKEVLIHYDWPGNLRELHNFVKRVALLAEGGIITLDVIHPELIGQARSGVDARRSAASDSIQERGESLKSASSSVERESILRALHKAEYNKSAAARMLDIDRKTLYNKLKKYSIDT